MNHSRMYAAALAVLTLCLPPPDADARSWQDARALSPLYQMSHATITDQFYTSSKHTAEAALVCCNYLNLSVAAWVPVVPDRAAPYGPLPFMRFWMPAPTSEHFYTISQTDADFVLDFGYSAEGYEGTLWSSSLAGSDLHALYRLNRYVPATGDLQHYYTQSTTMRDQLVGQGWSLDGVAGYAYKAPTSYNGPSATYYTSSNGSLYIVPPFFDSLSGATESPARYACAASVEVVINGAYSRINEWRFGHIPGTFNTWGCYQRAAVSLQRGVRYTVRMIYGGARAFDNCPECIGSPRTLVVKHPSDRTVAFTY